jgi:hypothetical protein
MSFKPRTDPTPSNGHLANEPSYWWTNPDHPDEHVKIRPLWNEVQQHLLEKHTRPGRRGVPELNRPAYYKALYDYLIDEWIIFQDDEGTEELPCTPENKYGLWRTSSERADAIFDEARRLANDDAARRDAERQTFRRAHSAEAGSQEQLRDMPAVIPER